VTPREAIFYGEYIKDRNGTRAAMAAGAPLKSAHVWATRTLRKPEIRAAVDAWTKSQCAKLEITAELVLQETAKLATYDPGKLYDGEGNRIPVHKLDDHTRAAVCSIEDDTQETPAEKDAEGHIVKAAIVTRKQKIRMADKGPHLERLGKHLKLFGGDSFGATVETPGGLPPDSTIKIVLVRPA
jgi:phage terminase small subunit